MYKLVFHKEAEKEYDSAYGLYGLQKPGLEERFRMHVEAVLLKLQANPQHFGYTKKPFREALVKVFPYTIVFTINSDYRTVYISAIFHTRRSPRKKYRKIEE